MSDEPALSTLFGSVLRDERIRNARKAAWLRALLVSAFFANNVLINQAIHGDEWQSGQTIFLLYALLAWVVLGFALRSDPVAMASSLAIPFLDMPLVFAVAHVTADGGPLWPAHSMLLGLAAVFCMLIVISTLTLAKLHMLLASAVAIVLSVVFALANGVPLESMGFSVILTGSVAAACLYLRHRILALVYDTSSQQVRRERMSRFFSPEVARTVEELEDPSAGTTRTVTVLVSDLRGFTALSNRLDSEKVVDLLNGYLNVMVDRIFDHGGTLDKFMGDGILAYFGAPLEQPDHAQRAVRCALDMQQALGEFNRHLGLPDGTELQMGIGLHTGDVILGAIGSPSRREFTVIGEAVNLASRIEQLTKTYRTPVLFSAGTRRRLNDEIPVEELEPATVRGIDRPVRLFRYQSGGASWS